MSVDDLGSTQPRCGECGTIMRDHRAGWRCSGCGQLLDLSAELAAVVVPDADDLPGIRGG